MQQNLPYKNAKVIDTSRYIEKTYLASLKSDIEKSDIDKLDKIPTIIRSLKSKVNKLIVDKLASVSVNLKK